VRAWITLMAADLRPVSAHTQGVLGPGDASADAETGAASEAGNDSGAGDAADAGVE
jgi:hypothetical protein